jgi:transketolase
MRRAFSDTLLKLAEENEKIIFLTGDLGFGVFDEFIEKFPKRYINTGVAEGLLINAAVGLALEGWKPIVYSIGPFAICRPFEQIKVNVSYHCLPILIIGAGGGFTYSDAGVTHHSQEDLALMSLLPNMTVAAPGGPDELEALMPQLLELKSPSYMRVGKFGEPNVNHDSSIVLGRGRKLLRGKKIVVVTVGDIVSEIYPAVEEFNNSHESVSLYHFHTVKPIDTELLNEISIDYNDVVVIEETIPQGGIYNELCKWKANKETSMKIHRRGAADAFVFGSPKREELRKRMNVDAESIIEVLKSLG